MHAVHAFSPHSTLLTHYTMRLHLIVSHFSRAKISIPPPSCVSSLMHTHFLHFLSPHHSAYPFSITFHIHSFSWCMAIRVHINTHYVFLTPIPNTYIRPINMLATTCSFLISIHASPSSCPFPFPLKLLHLPHACHLSPIPSLPALFLTTFLYLSLFIPIPYTLQLPPSFLHLV